MSISLNLKRAPATLSIKREGSLGEKRPLVVYEEEGEASRTASEEDPFLSEMEKGSRRRNRGLR